MPSRAALRRNRARVLSSSCRGGMEQLESRQMLTTLQPGYVEQFIGSSITNPTAMQFAPDGRLFVLQQTGQVRIIKNGSLLATPATTFAVDSTGERGLLGLAFDPNFATNGFLYLYNTPNNLTPRRNVITRVTMSGDTVVANSATTIYTLDALTSATNHNGGAMNFGADGKLYVAVGDNATPSNAQVITNRHGKMLRLNSDGTIPSDNPTSISGISGTTTGANRAIYSAGLRNPFTFAVQPGTGRQFVLDVGQSAWEEINENGPGRNFGWSSTEGDFNQSSFPNFTRPVYAYDHSNGLDGGLAITGGTFYNPSVAPLRNELVGDFFFADFVRGSLRKLDASSNYQAINLNGGNTFRAQVNYDGTVLGLVLTDLVTNASNSFAFNVNIPAAIGSSTAHIGFTGATGGLRANQDILNLTYTPTTGSSVNFANFSSTSGLQLNSAAAQSGNRLRITNTNSDFQAGSFFTTSRFNVNSFSTTFDFQLGSAGADGFAFVLQGNSAGALGTNGSGLGYQGIGNSVALKFDFFNNSGEGGDSVGVYTGGAAPTTPAIDVNGFASGLDSPVDLKVGPDGAIYYLQRGGTPGVYRIANNAAVAPSISTQPTNVTISETQNAVFTVNATGQAPLSYQWFRNNVAISGATSATYTRTSVPLSDNGSTYFVRVSNTLGSIDSNTVTLTVNANQLPNVVINTPTPGSTFIAGNSYNFSGTATDPEDGLLGLSNTSWRVSYFTNVVERPFVPETPGSSGSFTIPTITPYLLTDVFYRVYFTGTDSTGAAVTVSRDILPITSNVTLTTNLPVANNVLLDGTPLAAPHTFSGVAGITRNIEVPTSVLVGDQTWEFVSWSDGGARNHDISTPVPPPSTTTFSATFRDATAPAMTGGSVVLLDSGDVVLSYVFSEDVGASLSSSSLSLFNAAGGSLLTNVLAFSYDTPTRTATYTIATNGLPTADIRARITTAADGAGNTPALLPENAFYLLGAAAGGQNLTLGTAGANLTFSDGTNTVSIAPGAQAGAVLRIVPQANDVLSATQAALSMLSSAGVQVELVIANSHSLTLNSTGYFTRMHLAGGSLLSTLSHDLVLPGAALADVREALNDGRIDADDSLLSGITPFGAVLALATGETTGFTEFASLPILPSTVIGKFTYGGDANLDGKVDAFDYSRVDDFFGLNDADFAQGDLNQDGVVNAFDYSSIDDNFGAGIVVGPITTASAASASGGFAKGVSEAAVTSLLRSPVPTRALFSQLAVVEEKDVVGPELLVL